MISVLVRPVARRISVAPEALPGPGIVLSCWREHEVALVRAVVLATIHRAPTRVPGIGRDACGDGVPHPRRPTACRRRTPWASTGSIPPSAQNSLGTSDTGTRLRGPCSQQ